MRLFRYGELYARLLERPFQSFCSPFCSFVNYLTYRIAVLALFKKGVYDNIIVVLFLIICSVLVSCSNVETQDVASLYGGEWSLVSIEGEELKQRTIITLSLENSKHTEPMRGIIRGECACNLYVGEYVVDGKTIKFNKLSPLRPVCSKNIRHLGDRFMSTMKKVDNFVLTNAKLVMYSAEGGEELVFEAPVRKVSGKVYFKDIKLNKSLVITVLLQEVSFNHAPLNLGKQIIKPQENEVDYVNFEIWYPPSYSVRFNSDLILMVEVVDGNILRFVSSEAESVNLSKRKDQEGFELALKERKLFK